MRNKRVKVIHIGHVDPVISDAVMALLEGRTDEADVCVDDATSGEVDFQSFMKQLDASLGAFFREPFRTAHEARIERSLRKWPRKGCPLLSWNRTHKWQPRCFSGPPRRIQLSQSQLRLSQILSWRQANPGRLRRDSSILLIR